MGSRRKLPVGGNGHPVIIGGAGGGCEVATAGRVERVERSLVNVPGVTSCDSKGLRRFKKGLMSRSLSVAVLGLALCASSAMAGGSVHYQERSDYKAQAGTLSATNAFLQLRSLNRQQWLYHEQGANEWIWAVSSTLNQVGLQAGSSDTWTRYDGDNRTTPGVTWALRPDTDSFSLSVGHAEINFVGDLTNGVVPSVYLYQTNVVQLITGYENPAVARTYSFSWLVRDLNAFGEPSAATRTITTSRSVYSGSTNDVQADFGGANQVVVVAVLVTCSSAPGIFIQIDPCIELGGRGTEPSGDVPAGWIYGRAGLRAVMSSEFEGVRPFVANTVLGTVVESSTYGVGYAKVNGQWWNYEPVDISRYLRFEPSNTPMTPNDPDWLQRTAKGVQTIAYHAARFGAYVVAFNLGTWESADGTLEAPFQNVGLMPTISAETTREQKAWHVSVRTRTSDVCDYVYLGQATEVGSKSWRRRAGATIENAYWDKYYWGHPTYFRTIAGGATWTPTPDALYGLPGILETWGPKTDGMAFIPQIGGGTISVVGDPIYLHPEQIGTAKEDITYASCVYLTKRTPQPVGAYRITLNYVTSNSLGCALLNGDVQTEIWTIALPTGASWFLPGPSNNPNWRMVSLNVECLSNGGPVEYDQFIPSY